MVDSRTAPARGNERQSHAAPPVARLPRHRDRRSRAPRSSTRAPARRDRDFVDGGPGSGVACRSPRGPSSSGSSPVARSPERCRSPQGRGALWSVAGGGADRPALRPGSPPERWSTRWKTNCSSGGFVRPALREPRSTDHRPRFPGAGGRSSSPVARKSGALQVPARGVWSTGAGSRGGWADLRSSRLVGRPRSVRVRASLGPPVRGRRSRCRPRHLSSVAGGACRGLEVRLGRRSGRGPPRRPPPRWGHVAGDPTDRRRTQPMNRTQHRSAGRRARGPGRFPLASPYPPKILFGIGLADAYQYRHCCFERRDCPYGRGPPRRLPPPPPQDRSLTARLSCPQEHRQLGGPLGDAAIGT